MSLSPASTPAATRLAFLEGMRGLAAMQVLLLHYCAMVLPYAARVDDVRHVDAENWIAATPLFFLINGHVAVQLFFLISGTVLAASFLRSDAPVPAQILKRFLRLLLPALAAIGFAVALLHWLPMDRAGLVELVKSDWTTRYMNTPLQLAAVARDSLLDSILLGYQDVSLFDGILAKEPWLSSIGSAAVPPLWTLHVEFWGSMLVLALATAYRRLGSRGFGVVLALVLVLTGSSAYTLFVVGFLLHLFWRQRLRVKTASPSLLTVPLIMAGVLLATMPALSVMNALLGLMDKLSVLRAQSATMLQSQIGAVLIFIGVISSTRVRQYLSVPPLTWLGQLSFSIYLLHFAVMALIGSRILLALADQGIGYLWAGSISLFAGTVITFLLALGFERFIDRPAIALAARFSTPTAKVP
ncbi:acyltransferase [Pigmentiphaga aceris]|uniref:Acyltransferase n=1 Tax=Pigmentiphaga aceris TaxID=1940612 RepID=A0A5C0B4Q8_9BURK|nr:acyltransferase family protein [Pigmentiphaga aceris]QEI08643.1 acyltransferase [Pigmentiphaga aceris]